MKRFMAMLSRNKDKDPPPTKLLDRAEELCQDLQSSFPSLEKLVGVMMGSKHKMHFLTNIHVVRACVRVHVRNGQHDTACRLLESCRAEEKEQLVQLWYEIHYQRFMEKCRTDSLTSLQKFRCRKRNPPPLSICPEGLKPRNHPEEVRQYLFRFAAVVTTHPDRTQRQTNWRSRVECVLSSNSFEFINQCPQSDPHRLIGDLEFLARDTNLHPNQVSNWFANYRRRQKARLRQMEKLNNSCPERALASHTKEQQDKGFYAPQTAGSEQMEITRMTCEPGWEQLAADLYEPPEGTYLKMLETSFMPSSELYEAGTSRASFTPYITEQPVPFCTEAVLEPGTCFSSAVLQPREAVHRAVVSPQRGDFVLRSCGCLPFPDGQLAMQQAPCSTGGWWASGIEAGVRAPLSRVPQGGCIEASSGRIIQQSDLEAESSIVREEQLGTLESIPYSSCQTVFGKPQCPPVSAPFMEENQALGQSQVPQDPASDPLTSDTYWAAWVLFEFSASARV